MCDTSVTLLQVMSAALQKLDGAETSSGPAASVQADWIGLAKETSDEMAAAASEVAVSASEEAPSGDAAGPVTSLAEASTAEEVSLPPIPL